MPEREKRDIQHKRRTDGRAKARGLLSSDDEDPDCRSPRVLDEGQEREGCPERVWWLRLGRLA
jgi:hypothetical protein